EEKKRPAYWGDPVYVVGEKAKDSKKNHPNNPHIPEDGVGLNLRDANGDYCGFAPRGAKLRMGAESAKKGYNAVAEIVSGQVAPAELPAGATAFLKELEKTAAEPSTRDAIVVPDAPIAISAGDLIGHLGEYQRYSDMNPMAETCTERPLVQLDVFAEPKALEDFIKKSQARDAQLDAKQKTLLHIQPGAQFVQPAEADVEVPAGESVLFVGGDASNRWIKGRRGTVQTVERASLGNITMATRTYPNGSIFISAINPTDGSELTLEQFNALADKSPYSQRKVLTPTTEVWLDRSVADRFNTVPTPA